MIYIFFLYMILNKKTFESHKKKPESVGEKRVKYCHRMRFLTNLKKKRSSKPHNFSQSGPIYFIFFYMIPIKKLLSRAIKTPESVGDKMVSRSRNRRHTFFLGLIWASIIRELILWIFYNFESILVITYYMFLCIFIDIFLV